MHLALANDLVWLTALLLVKEVAVYQIAGYYIPTELQKMFYTQQLHKDSPLPPTSYFRR